MSRPLVPDTALLPGDTDDGDAESDVLTAQFAALRESWREAEATKPQQPEEPT